MTKQSMLVVSVLYGLGLACGSRASGVRRDGAVDVGLQASGGAGHTTATGSGGATVSGTGGTTVAGTGGPGGSVGGAGGSGTRLDGATPPTDGSVDRSVPADGSAEVMASWCESAGDTCVPTIGGCAVCPGGYAKSTRMGCPSNSWCCTRAVPPSNPCTQSGNICGIPGSCPDGWMEMRTECDPGSGAQCCASRSAVCTAAHTTLDASPPPDAVDAPPPPPDPLGLACTKAISCLAADAAEDQGIGNCVAGVSQLRGMDQSLWTYPMLLNDDRDWLFHFGLAQNVDCIAAADGCQAVRACLAPPQSPTLCASGSNNYLFGRRCSDATHLVGCSLDMDVRVDCAKLGTTCVESPPTASGDLGLAACALPSPGGPPTPQVTCAGTVAKVKLREAEYAYDCGINATCVAGSHAFSVDDQLCKGKAPATLTCASSEITRRCDGENLVISCPDGSEQVGECLREGRRCLPSTNGQLFCTAPCSTSADQCIGGVITYCAGPNVRAKLDCASLGFSGCQTDTSVRNAWCVE